MYQSCEKCYHVFYGMIERRCFLSNRIRFLRKRYDFVYFIIYLLQNKPTVKPIYIFGIIILLFCFYCNEKPGNNGQKVKDSIKIVHSEQNSAFEKNSANIPKTKQIDSLLQKLSVSSEDTLKVNILNELSRANRNIQDYDEALIFAEKSLELAQKLSFKNGIANAYNSKGNIYYRQGNYPESLTNHLASLKIRETENDKRGMATSYNNIGNLHTSQENYDEALKWYSKALPIFRKMKDRSGESAALGNIANIYYAERNFDEALKQTFAVLKIEKELGDKKGMSGSYNTIGGIYIEKEKYSEGVEYFFKALEIYKEFGDTNEAATAYLNIGDTYVSSLNRFDEGKKYLKKGLEISQKAGAKETVRNIYLRLVSADSLQGNYQYAFEHYKNYITYRDSLSNKANIKKQTELEMQYQFDKKQLSDSLKYQINIAKTEEKATKNRNRLIITILFLALAIAVSAYWRKRSLLLKKEKILIGKEKEVAEQQALRARMNPHFIFNCMNTIDAFILQNKQDEASELVQKFSKLTRKVLELSDTESITLQDELDFLKLYLDIESIRHKGKFTFSISAEPETLMLKIPPMIIQPIVENALLHGIRNRKEKEGGTISIKTKKSGNLLLITVEDNGVGREQAKLIQQKKTRSHDSKATEIIRERLKYLFDELPENVLNYTDLENNSGTIAELKIPTNNINDD